MSTTEVTLTADDAERLGSATRVAGRSLQLPLFEAERPTGTLLKGSLKVDRLTPPLRRNEKVYLLVEAHVTGVNHTTGKGDVVIREHSLEIEDAFLLDSDEGAYRASELEDEHRAAVDEALGRQQLPGMSADDDADDDADDSEGDEE